jgi:histidine ammonia-lyase
VRARHARLSTIEALHGSSKPFHPLIHEVRVRSPSASPRSPPRAHPARRAAQPHRGQSLVAARVRAVLQYGMGPSEIMQSHASCGRVQDSYTLRLDREA